MNLAKKGSSVLLVNWLLVPLQLITQIVVVRTLGAAGQGTVVLLNTTILLLASVGQFGLPAATIYFARSGIYTERTLLACFAVVNVVVSACVALLVVFAHGAFVALFLNGAEVNAAVLGLALAGLPLASAVAFFTTLLLAHGLTREYAQLRFGISLLTVVGTLVLVPLLGLGLVGALLAQIIAQLLTVTAISLGRLRATRGQACLWGWSVYKAILGFGFQHYLGTLGSQMFKRLDSFLLAYFLDVRAVGYYSVATTAYEALLSIPRAISGLLAGEAAGKDADHAGVYVAQTTRNVLWIMTAAAASVALGAVVGVPLLYGPDFVASLAPLAILLGAAVLVGLTIALQAYFLGIGKPGINGGLTMLGGFVNLALSLWLIPAAGIVGNALATLLGALALVGLYLGWFRHFTRLTLRDTLVLQEKDRALWLRYLRVGLGRFYPVPRQ